MKKFVILTIMIFWAHSLIIAQNPVQSEKTIIDKKGIKTITEQCQKSINNDIGTSIITTKNSEVRIIWQGIEETSTGGQIKVSSVTQNTFTGWNLNNDRCSYYPDYFYPLWESNFGEEADFCVDMLEDGSLMAAGKADSAKVFLTSSNVPVWKQHFTGSIRGIVLSPDGSTVYLSEELSSLNKVYSFDIETDTMNWELIYADDYYGNGLVLSGNGEFLVFYQYCNIYIIKPGDGTDIDQLSNYGEGIPAISDDGSILVAGDYTGYAQVYEYNSGTHTYNQLWTFHETGGIYSPWITSMSVSGDGTTIAIGSLIYEDPDNDIFNGKLHLFDTYSSTPVWNFENMGHFVSSIDMSHDGSTIAVGGWGPVDNSIPDFFLFERDSNEPIFSINTPGSIRFVDISSDGKICSLSGKAIHETTFGNGGTIYCVNTDPVPPAPENIELQIAESDLTLSWDMPEIMDFNYFNIYYAVDSGDYILLDSITDTVFNYNLLSSGLYKFYVTTVDLAEQESEPSDTVLCEYSSTDTDNNLHQSTYIFTQNYPNPFSSVTTITYSLPRNSNVVLVIYDVSGKKVKTIVNSYKMSGTYEVIWNGNNDNGKPVSKGIYYYNIRVGKLSSSKKMILMK